MTSSVFFKFKSQKEPTRVEFDGTGISVFELKRDIILKSGLGDGSDFDLLIYTDDGSEEYDDDTTIIPRATTVVARRQPPQKPGAGRAARYVSGKMPSSAKNSGRREAQAKAPKPVAPSVTQTGAPMTEQEKLAAMFQSETDQWSVQQEEMSHKTAVYKPGAKKPANVPDHEPPNGYICYRCGQKGHWIQLCPTNDDPDFDNRPRVKRTTGIPRSFLKTVDKSALQHTNADGEEVKPPPGLMVNADGDFVIHEPDKASWEQFQAKTKSSAAAQKAASAEDKELEERGLLCPIDNRTFIDPMKTPCCEKTYCNECITNALIESDFVCPGCQTDGVLIDDLQPDGEASTKIKDFLKEKESAKVKERSQSPPSVKAQSPIPSEVKEEKEETPQLDSRETKSPIAGSVKTESPTPPPAEVKPASPIVPKTSTTPSSTTSPSEPPKVEEPPKEATSKKRPAEESMENPKIPKGPKAMQRAQEAQDMQNMMPGMNGMNGMGGMMPNMMFPMNFNGMNGFNSNMNPMMGMMGMNPMMNPMMPMNGMNGFNPNMMNNMFGGNFGGMNGGGMGNMNGMNMNPNAGMNGMNATNNHHPNRNFNAQSNEDDAYFRKPVNPGRHQNRQRRVRPSDYREL
ncbi:DWNN domain-containing protein [Xylariaceae sp. FL1019]|nr:DWNN domain-containing protein [Xylariaceae sp. FL1019]